MSEQEYKAMLKEIGYSEYSIEILWANRPANYATMPANILKADALYMFDPYWAKLQDPRKDFRSMPELVYPMLSVGLS